eukprot:2395270-Amphidinium_carterae.2
MPEEGIIFKCNHEVGRDGTLADLCSQNDAVILATGRDVAARDTHTDLHRACALEVLHSGETCATWMAAT